MDTTKLPQFVTEYKAFKETPEYAERKAQLAIVPVLRRLIAATLQNEILTKEHLTGLLQACHGNRSIEVFKKYVALNVSDEKERTEIERLYEQCGQKGITGGGKASVYGIGAEELAHVRQFLLDAFDIKDVASAQDLVRNYHALQVPEVKQGVYSAWLYYINPALFPIYNASHNAFKMWLKIADNYAGCIADFADLRDAVEGEDLGLIDRFAYKYGYNQEGAEKINLEGQKLFKLSHGLFTKSSNSGYQEVANFLKEYAWICMGRNTGKGGGENFMKAKIGDFVYVCDGGSTLWYLTKIASDWKELPVELANQIDDGEDFIYRETEVIHLPTVESTRDLSKNNKNYMPSGNSTFWEVKPHELQEANSNLFKPKFNVEFFTEGSILEPEADISDDKLFSNSPLNNILYGPPGTGKTYNSVENAVRIIASEFFGTDKTREEVKQKFDELQEKGKIEFITFHQSLGYEDFIEGIKPLPADEDSNKPITYAVLDGLFKRLCTEAAFAFVAGQPSEAAAGKFLAFSDAYDTLVSRAREAIDNEAPLKVAMRNGKYMTITGVNNNNYLVLRHEGGTMDYTITKERLGKLAHAYPDLEEVVNINDAFKDVIGGSNASANYAALKEIRRIAPLPAKPSKTAEQYTYEEKKAAVAQLAQEDYKKGSSKRYVLIIDEINRGNVSSIFGELITLLEDDKRLGMPEALKAKLPYSGESFGVPPNLYIIGTMNTADRSVEALDTALRRRFDFVRKGPESKELTDNCEGVNLKLLLEKLNRRLTILIDEDHTIGHAWLWNVETLEDLKAKFKSRILPLLREYFYNDYEKLGRVLGDNFFLPAEEAKLGELAPFSLGRDEADDYSDSVILNLKEVADLKVEDFQSIYQ